MSPNRLRRGALHLPARRSRQNANLFMREPLDKHFLVLMGTTSGPPAPGKEDIKARANPPDNGLDFRDRRYDRGLNRVDRFIKPLGDGLDHILKSGYLKTDRVGGFRDERIHLHHAPMDHLADGGYMVLHRVHFFRRALRERKETLRLHSQRIDLPRQLRAHRFQAGRKVADPSKQSYDRQSLKEKRQRNKSDKRDEDGGLRLGHLGFRLVFFVPVCLLPGLECGSQLITLLL